MAVYSMGKLIEEVDDIAEPEEDTAEKKAPVQKSAADYSNYKHGYLSKFRQNWTEADVAIVQSIADGLRIKDISCTTGLKEKNFHDVLAILRRSRKAKTNSELVAIAMREGTIK